MKSLKMPALVVLMLFTNVNIFSQTEKSEAGFFATVQDYYENKITNVGEFGAADINKVIFTKDGKKTVYASRDLKDWGFRDARGFDWRVFDRQNYGIIEKGKIVVYAKCFLKTDKKEPNNVEVDAEMIYVSLGYDGPLYCFTKDKRESIRQIASWMQKDNPQLSAKFEKDNYAFFPADVKKAVTYIQEFNDGIAKQNSPRYVLKLKVIK